jgi:hypothetical protein
VYVGAYYHGYMVASAPILATKLYILLPPKGDENEVPKTQEHEQILRELEEQFGPLFDRSPVEPARVVTTAGA